MISSSSGRRTDGVAGDVLAEGAAEVQVGDDRRSHRGNLAAGRRSAAATMRLMEALSEERLAPSNGIELAYQEVGDPDGEPLLLIMGLGDPDARLGRGALRDARRARLPGHPLRQPRHRPLDDDRRGGDAGPPRHDARPRATAPRTC